MPALSDVAPATPAAQYLRMSTDHQRYSLENQQAAIAECAACHGYEVVRTYADPGKSGLTLKGRTSLQALLSDAMAPDRRFDAVLVLDVSRWGRFQDPDEAAHYEFICRQAGLQVIYCAELFSVDPDSLDTKLLKHIKRVMAGEFSRELSAKIYRAQRQQAALGFLQAGGAPYGFRRLVVDRQGRPRMLLEFGQQKAIAADRTVLIPGPHHEQATVRRIFRWCANGKLSPGQIAKKLSVDGVRSDKGMPWSKYTIYRIIRNEIYTGWYNYAKTTQKLGNKSSNVPSDSWIRVKVAAPMVSGKIFRKAQTSLESRKGARHTDRQLLDRLRKIFEVHGYISLILLKRLGAFPSHDTYIRRFGSLKRAYALVGYTSPLYRGSGKGSVPWTDAEILEGLQRLHQRHGYASLRLISDDPSLPSPGSVAARFGSLTRAYELAGLPFRLNDIQAAAIARRKVRERELPRSKFPRPNGRGMTPSMPTDEMLIRLRTILANHGYLSQRLIEEEPGMPSPPTIARRFGSLARAYAAAGWRREFSTIVIESHKRQCLRLNEWLSARANDGSSEVL